MAWLTLTLDAGEHDAEALSEALLELGALSVDVLDAQADTSDEQPIFGEPGEPAPSLWQQNRLTAIFPSDAPVDDLLQQAVQAAGLGQVPPHRIDSLQDDDWVRLTQAQFDPIRISERLWIVPTWHEPADPAAINIVLDPGLAFGTGSHPTTRLCLRWLDKNLKGGERVLDYGCGSGILAIAALKLGAAQAIGVDIDPQAVQSSHDNAEANGVQAQFFLPNNAPQQQADVVVANILTNPLKLLAPLLAGSVHSGGRVALSGILQEQAEDVMGIYSQWFDLGQPIVEDGWVCLSGTRK